MSASIHKRNVSMSFSSHSGLYSNTLVHLNEGVNPIYAQSSNKKQVRKPGKKGVAIGV